MLLQCRRDRSKARFQRIGNSTSQPIAMSFVAVVAP